MVRYAGFLKFAKLLQQLTQFGLDPAEWQIQDFYARENVVHLRHRNDPEFELTGYCSNLSSQSPQWQSLCVRSV